MFSKTKYLRPRAAGYATYRFDGFAIPCLLTKDFQPVLGLSVSFSIPSIKCFYHHQRQYFFSGCKSSKTKTIEITTIDREISLFLFNQCPD